MRRTGFQIVKAAAERERACAIDPRQEELSGGEVVRPPYWNDQSDPDRDANHQWVRMILLGLGLTGSGLFLAGLALALWFASMIVVWP